MLQLILQIMVVIALVGQTSTAYAEKLGEVNTAFKLVGPDHKIIVEVLDDPRVQGISCYISRAKSGGLSGALGIAEDTADASISCGQVGDVRFFGPVPQQEEVFNAKTSLLFKHQRIVRLVDAKRNVLTYLTYSDRLIDGSPKNSVSHVQVPQTQRIPVK